MAIQSDRREGAAGFLRPDGRERDSGRAAGGSMTFSLRTEQGRVLVCVPNGLLAQTFGATGAADEIFATFAQHIDLLNAAALARLNDSATFPAEIILDERDIAQAQKQSWNVAGRDLQ